MEATLTQLGIDHTFYTQFGLFFVIFLIVPRLFFKPFQKLIEDRHEKTVIDREKAIQLVAQANQKMDEYKEKISEERTKIRAEYEKILTDVKKEEAEILAKARVEAKEITHEASDLIVAQTAQIKRALEADVEGIALQISETLLKRQG